MESEQPAVKQKPDWQKIGALAAIASAIIAVLLMGWGNDGENIAIENGDGIVLVCSGGSKCEDDPEELQKEDQIAARVLNPQFLCNGESRVFAQIVGLHPGEQISMIVDPPPTDHVEIAPADHSGVKDLTWYCTADEQMGTHQFSVMSTNTQSRRVEFEIDLYAP